MQDGASVSYDTSCRSVMERYGSSTASSTLAVPRPTTGFMILRVVLYSQIQLVRICVDIHSGKLSKCIRLGNMNSRATVNLLNAGVLNCVVTATDVRNHTAATGVIIAEVRRKTSKMTPTAASASYMAPRVTQVQQSLPVDSFFIKGLAFLIGKL